eukprot:scaffold43814_cov87-Phaeocystis_antarctica.AAC.1
MPSSVVSTALSMCGSWAGAGARSSRLSPERRARRSRPSSSRELCACPSCASAQASCPLLLRGAERSTPCSVALAPRKTSKDVTLGGRADTPLLLTGAHGKAR